MTHAQGAAHPTSATSSDLKDPCPRTPSPRETAEAIEVVMALRNVTRMQAVDLLRVAASCTGTPVAAIVVSTVSTGEFDFPPREDDGEQR